MSCHAHDAVPGRSRRLQAVWRQGHRREAPVADGQALPAGARAVAAAVAAAAAAPAAERAPDRSFLSLLGVLGVPVRVK